MQGSFTCIQAWPTCAKALAMPPCPAANALAAAWAAATPWPAAMAWANAVATALALPEAIALEYACAAPFPAMDARNWSLNEF